MHFRSLLVFIAGGLSALRVIAQDFTKFPIHNRQEAAMVGSDGESIIVALENNNGAKKSLDVLGIPLVADEFKALLKNKIHFEGNYSKKEKKQFTRKTCAMFDKLRDENELTGLRMDVFLRYGPDSSIVLTDRMEKGFFALYDPNTISIQLNPRQERTFAGYSTLKHEIAHGFDHVTSTAAFSPQFIAKEYKEGRRLDTDPRNGLPFVSTKEQDYYQEAANSCFNALKEVAQCFGDRSGCATHISKQLQEVVQYHTPQDFPFTLRPKDTKEIKKILKSEYRIGETFLFSYNGYPETLVTLREKSLPGNVTLVFNNPAYSFFMSTKRNLEMIDYYKQDTTWHQYITETNGHFSGTTNDKNLERVCPSWADSSKKRFGSFAERYKKSQSKREVATKDRTVY